jgi:hypothetical protein
VGGLPFNESTVRCAAVLPENGTEAELEKRSTRGQIFSLIEAKHLSQEPEPPSRYGAKTRCFFSRQPVCISADLEPSLEQ